jgi:GNAT superfamily N-acetyltransferase
MALCKGPSGEEQGMSEGEARRNPGEGEGGPSKLAFVRPEHRKKHRATKWRWCLWRFARAPAASGKGMRSPPGEHNPGEGEGGPSKLAFVRPEHRKKHIATRLTAAAYRFARAPAASGWGMRSPPGEHNPPPYNPKFAFSCIPSPKAL